MLKTIIVLPDGTELSSGATGTNAVQSITITEMVNDSQELTLGSTCANMLEAKLITPEGGLPIAKGDELTVYREDRDGVRHKVGRFTTEKPTRPSANTMAVTAYDRVSWLDKDLSAWFAGLNAWPYTLYGLAKKVCTACGLTLANDNIPNGGFLIQAFSADGLTGRQLMRWIGQVAGRFCRATADGLIEFAWYTATDAKLAPTGDRFYYQNSLTFEDYVTHPIEKVQLRLTNDDVGVIYPNVAEELNTYIITGNYLLTTSTTENLLPIAQHLYETLQGVSYTPCKVSAFDGQGIRAGDIIQITDANGKTITTYVMTRTLTGQKVTLESTGSYRRDSSSAMNSLSLQALSGKMLQIRQSVEGFRVTASELKGRAIYDTQEEFYVSTSATELVGGSWGTEAPDWTAGAYIWRRYKITRGDGNVTYTPSEKGMCINDISIGGRNLIRNSEDLHNVDYYFASGKPTTEAETKRITATGETVTIKNAVPVENSFQVRVSGVDDPTDVTVYRYGKNLFDPNKLLQYPGRNTYDEATGLWTTTSAGGWSSSLLYNANGGTSARDITKLIRVPPNTTITVKLFSIINNTGLADAETIQCSVHDSTGAWVNNYKGFDTITFATPSEESWVDIRRYNNAGTVSFSEIQIEIGTASTEFAKYVEPQLTTPNADGTVEGIAPLYPYMTLFADAAGATLDVAYNTKMANANGKVVTITDAAPEEHDLIVCVSGVDDPASVTVYRCGKNLFTGWVSGRINSGDGKFYDSAVGVRTDYIPIPYGTTNLYISGLTKSLSSMMTFYDAEKNYIGRTNGNPVTTLSATVPNGAFFCALTTYEVSTSTGTVAENTPTAVQIEIGTTETEYEAFVEQKAAKADTNGVVTGLTSLYPYMTIFPDTDGAVLNVSYNRVAALESVAGLNPENKSEKMAMMSIEDLPEAFVIPNIKLIGREYTLSLWLRSEEAGSLTINDITTLTTTEWKKQTMTFTADSTDLQFMFDVIGTYYIYHPKLELGNKATDWTPAPEDVEETIQEEIGQVKETVERNFADLTVQSDGIMAEVSKTQENVDGIREQIATMEQTATGLSLRIKEIQDTGVSKVTTETGYTFGSDGLHISGAEGMENVLDEKGMVVTRSDEVVLQANESGVIATDVKVRNYLIVGTHARFEDYSDGSNRNRTACFFLDGG